MLDIVLQILSVLGIILLVLLLITVVLILLVLFFPITYRINGSKNGKDITFQASARWLFGLLRVNYAYPEPGKIVAKLLWIKIFDSAEKPRKKTDSKESPKTPKDAKTKDGGEEKNHEDTDKIIEATEKNVGNADTGNSTTTQNVLPDQEISQQNVTEPTEEIPGKPLEKFWKKLEKIQYTFRNICDKIKMIWENISYYKELLQEKNTRELFSHVCLRVGKILKSIRPRHLEACILMGTGSPDTTGYLYGAYGMLLSVLGPKVLVTPDFEQAILEGNVRASGHITVAVLLINGLKLFFDKKLHLFLQKLKAAPGKENTSTGNAAK